MNPPDEPQLDPKLTPIEWIWHWLQLFAWYLWPENDCPYCWWYRGVGIGLLLGGIITWLISIIWKSIV